MGIKHATTADGTVINSSAVWSENHTIDGDVDPASDNAYDLGGATTEWKDLYVDGVAYVDAFGESLIPNADDSLDLGSATAEWKDLYVDGTAEIDAANIDTLTSNTQTRGNCFVWKDADAEALSLANQAATVAFTDLDLTAHTSSNAKIAYLQLYIQIDTAAKGYMLSVRKNGTTPSYYPTLDVNADEAHAGDVFRQVVSVGVDSDEVIEYYCYVEAGGQADFKIGVLGYWE